MMDFEKEAINAVEFQFTNGWFFLFITICVASRSRSWITKKKYGKNSDFALCIRMLPFLTHVPTNKVVEAFG